MAAAPESEEASRIKLFVGHTLDEAYLFNCTCIWFLQPLALCTFPAALGWRPRPFEPRAPGFAVVSVIASLLHWSNYQPRSARQYIDVAVAAVLVALVIYDMLQVVLATPVRPPHDAMPELMAQCCCSYTCLDTVGASRASACPRLASRLSRAAPFPARSRSALAAQALASPTESRLLWALFVCFLACAELDIFHKVHSAQLLGPGRGTTHVTGTRLHIALRFLGCTLSTLSSGGTAASAASAPAVGALQLVLATAAAQGLHAALCGVASARWGLAARPPLAVDLLVGLGGSGLLVAGCLTALPVVFAL